MTNGAHKGVRAAGWVLHALIAGLLVFAGAGKVFGFVPPEVLKKLADQGLGGRIVLIGAGEMVCALLLLVPRTLSLGLLLTSGFWGGAICFQMSHGEPFAPQSVLLLLTWLGAYLRDPRTFASFRAAESVADVVPRPTP